PFFERAFELGRRDRERLQEPEHVGEPQPDEADVPLLDGAEDVLLVEHHRGLAGVSSLYPTLRTVAIIASCSAPSFARRRRTCTSTVRVPPKKSYPHTSWSKRERENTRPGRSAR